MVLFLALLATSAPPSGREVNYEKLVKRFLYQEAVPKTDPHLDLLNAVISRGLPNAVIDPTATPLSVARYINYHPGNLVPDALLVAGSQNVRPEFFGLSADDPRHPDSATAGGGFDDLVPHAGELADGWFLPRSRHEYDRLKRRRAGRREVPPRLVFRSATDAVEAGDRLRAAAKTRAEEFARLRPWDVLPVPPVPADLNLMHDDDPCLIREARVEAVLSDRSFLARFHGAYVTFTDLDAASLREGEWAYFGPNACFCMTHFGTTRLPDGNHRAMPHFKRVDTELVASLLRSAPKSERRRGAHYADGFIPGWRELYEAKRAEAKRAAEQADLSDRIVHGSLAVYGSSGDAGGKTQYVHGHINNGHWVQGYFRSPRRR